MGVIFTIAGKEIVGNKQGVKILKSLFNNKAIDNQEKIQGTISLHNISNN